MSLMTPRLSVLFLSMAVGCTWIDDAERDGRLGQVDDDGDGVVASRDCDEENPNISTAQPEIWYDGTDGDCGGDDDYDQDGDGYVPVEFVGLTTLGVKGSGTLTGGDCDDQEQAVSPQQKDAWYDGVDRACDGGDDYDQDGDGFVPDEYVGLTTTYLGTSGLLPGGDCDDDNSAIRPDSVESWYDGLDSDCSGDNDYDQDGDGYVPDEWFAVAGGLPSGDCHDGDADIHPGALEVWYDGIDEACDGADDYDQDADGYVPTVHLGKDTAGVDGTGDLPGGDCDDEDLLAHPYANEQYGDTNDRDCDGGRDSLQLRGVTGYTWVNPNTPVFVEAHDRVYLSVAVEQVRTPTKSYFDSGVAMTWDRGSIQNDSAVVGEYSWASSTSDTSFDVGTAHSLRLYDDMLVGVIGRVTANSRALAFEAFPLTSGTGGQSTAQTNNMADDAFAAADVYVDSAGRIFGIGCDPGSNGVLTYARVDDITSPSATVHANEAEGVGAASDCEFIDGSELSVLLAGAADLTEVTFDPDSPAPSFSYEDLDLGWVASDLDTDRPENPVWVIALPSLPAVYVEATGVSAFIGQATDAPASAAAIELDSGDYLVGWVNDDGTARLAKGSDSTGFSYIALNFDGLATGIALWSDADNAMVAVTSDDQVAVGIYDW